MSVKTFLDTFVEAHPDRPSAVAIIGRASAVNLSSSAISARWPGATKRLLYLEEQGRRCQKTRNSERSEQERGVLVRCSVWRDQIVVEEPAVEESAQEVDDGVALCDGVGLPQPVSRLEAPARHPAW